MKLTRIHEHVPPPPIIDLPPPLDQGGVACLQPDVSSGVASMKI